MSYSLFSCYLEIVVVILSDFFVFLIQLIHEIVPQLVIEQGRTLETKRYPGLDSPARHCAKPHNIPCFCVIIKIISLK